MIAADILLDGLFAAIAAIGFGAVSDPPMRAFPRIALLAAMGHALRFCLMHYFSADIATASLFASISIGFGSLWLGRGIRCPMTAPPCCRWFPASMPTRPSFRSSCSCNRSTTRGRDCNTCSNSSSTQPYR